MTKMIYIASTGLRRSARLDNNTKQKYGLFTKFSLAVIGACEVAKNPHISYIIYGSFRTDYRIYIG